jgi:F-type H+-transporting ATPase subunit epsilon
MYLEIITPEKEVFKGSVHSVTFPGADGAFQVLTDHAPIISALVKGELSYKLDDKQEVSIQVEGGVVEVLNNNINVLVERVIEE